MPPESGTPIRSSWLGRVSGSAASRQCARSRLWWMRTPGHHSKVEVAQ
jgi:hypothetical protein